MAFITGKNARVAIGPGPVFTSLPATMFTISTRAEEIDITNAESVRDGKVWADHITSFEEATLAVEILWDDSQDPFSLSLSPGKELFILVYPQKNDGIKQVFSFPNLLVTELDVTSEVRGIVRYSIKGMARRGYSYS